jgi:hypothetical protein
LRKSANSRKMSESFFGVRLPLNRPVPGSLGHVRQGSVVAVFRLCARSPAPRPWNESLVNFARSSPGTKSSPRLAARVGMEQKTLRVPVALGRDQRVRRRTENKSASTPSLDASFRALRTQSASQREPARSLAQAYKSRPARRVAASVFHQENEWATEKKNRKSR